jgi:AsmA protein
VSNQDLALKSPLLRVLGAGEASLPAETMDYLVKASVVGSLKGQGGQDLGELQGVTIPVRIGGTFSEPTFRPDLEAALSEAAKARVDAEIDKQKEKLQEKAGEEIQKQLGDKLEGDLGNQLKGLFK